LAAAKLRKNKKKSMFSLISKLIIFAAVIGCIISIVVTQSSLSEMQKELNSTINKSEEIEAENVELQRILQDDDMNAYMEELAIEKMNYAYPNERRYYDTSRN
jgi:regulator of replication initiation timing